MARVNLFVLAAFGREAVVTCPKRRVVEPLVEQRIDGSLLEKAIARALETLRELVGVVEAPASAVGGQQLHAEKAVDEMVRRTSTRAAPWHVVPANDKKYARIAAISEIVERLGAGVDLAPPSLKDRAPRVQSDVDGNEFWVVDEDMKLGPVGYCVIKPDGRKALGTVTLPRLEDMHPGASEPHARMAVMDEHGISRQIIYPNVLGFAGSFVMNIKDLALRNFCVHAYNEHAAELQRTSDGRLLPQALLPLWDIDLAVAELIRCHESYGLTGVVMTDSPELWQLPTLSEPYWDPLWTETQDRGLPINFHIGGGASIAQQADLLMRAARQLGADRPVVLGHSSGGAVATPS